MRLVHRLPEKTEPENNQLLAQKEKAMKTLIVLLAIVGGLTLVCFAILAAIMIGLFTGGDDE